MGTLNAIYIRSTDAAAARAIRMNYSSAVTEPGTRFFAVELPADSFRCPEAELQQLSKRLQTDVIWLSFQSVADAFQYYHWQSGKRVRALAYGCFVRDGEWEQAEGQPQEWEAAVLFNRDRVHLEHYTPAEQKQLKRIFREQILKVGSPYPSLDARETARGVAEYYRFPGWELSDEDDDQYDDEDDNWDDE
ncbi:MAG TPA: hypothetical protein VLI90_18980 [Tepidisphaeraceae bacterium]|nr:hypothetical protein [Tepidisphaeraceae bacterium]